MEATHSDPMAVDGLPLNGRGILGPVSGGKTKPVSHRTVVSLSQGSGFPLKSAAPVAILHGMVLTT